MCGIAGILFTEKTNPDWALPVVNNMLDSIAHRGPDDRNTYQNDVGFVSCYFNRHSFCESQ